ncbi:MAG: 4-aminobutyrate--2-oxoglutarate transaminase [Candidatus Eremiobacteraeota bacterium]|nr:4-aminobutyrate--2-oxoglutarate transaminase [Candidatus Eremiobacteraeota bacterium]
MKSKGIPGKRSFELIKVKEQYVPRGVFNIVPVFMKEAKGAAITDVDGTVLIDFAGGLGVLNIGHCHEEVVQAVKEQADRFLHGCFHVTMYESYVRLAEKLAEIAPGEFHKKSMFVNSGAEAVENAVKVARSATGRKGIIVFEAGFHGRTYLTMTMTSKVRPYKFGFGALAPEVYRIPYPYCYRCPVGRERAGCSMECLEFFTKFFAAHADPKEIAAVIIEPVTGEGGFIPAPPEYMEGLQKICREHGILFVADEVQTGFGRTGAFFASEHSGISPDIIISAKSLAGGLPLGAVTGKAELMDAPMVGGLGGTFGGNPLSCAAALKVIEVMQRKGFMKKARDQGKLIRDRLVQMERKYPLIGDVRGMGPMMAIELVKDRKKKTPASTETASIVKECHQRGLVILKAGIYDNVIRILAPLVTEKDLLVKGLDILEESMAAAKVTH